MSPRRWSSWGLKPLGGNAKSYLQPVPLLAYRAADEITRELADSPLKPSWNKGDFFGGKFALTPAGSGQ
jgi:hypothetical protein